MNDMTPAAGHNNPPDPIDDALAPYADALDESDSWLGGAPPMNEVEIKALDIVIGLIRKAKSDLAKAKKSTTAPLHDAWKVEIARWKPTEDDIERRLKSLVALGEPYRQKMAAEKEAIKRAAFDEAQRLEREARAAAAQADATDYAAQVEADRKAREAAEAKVAASEANKDKVRGLRTVTRFEITDHRAALHWIAANDRDAITEFVEDYVRRNHKTP